jgi:hypothetical protein
MESLVFFLQMMHLLLHVHEVVAGGGLLVRWRLLLRWFCCLFVWLSQAGGRVLLSLNTEHSVIWSNGISSPSLCNTLEVGYRLILMPTIEKSLVWMRYHRLISGLVLAEVDLKLWFWVGRLVAITPARAWVHLQGFGYNSGMAYVWSVLVSGRSIQIATCCRRGRTHNIALLLIRSHL